METTSGSADRGLRAAPSRWPPSRRSRSYTGRSAAARQGDADCPASLGAWRARSRRSRTGEIAALAVDRDAAIRDRDRLRRRRTARKLTLADFNGRALLLNLWATWCVPCRAEMPALDRLQAEAGGPGFRGRGGQCRHGAARAADAFLDEIGVKALARYADPSGDAFETLRVAGKALGLPTSLLIDKDGCELGVVAGPCQLDSADARPRWWRRWKGR